MMATKPSRNRKSKREFANEPLDARDRLLLNLLQANARLSFAELGRKVGLTPPAAVERVRRLEDRGIITGYRARVNPAALGRQLRVFLSVQVPPKEYPRFLKMIHSLDVAEECHHVTGNESFMVKAAVAGVAELEPLIQKFTAFGPTVTSVVLSTAVE